MNGYFQLIVTEKGAGVRVFPPKDGGDAITTQDVREYLDLRTIGYDLVRLDAAVQQANGAVAMINEAKGMFAERESYKLRASEDGMTATAFFYPPSDGLKGELMTADEVKKDLELKGITYGVDNAAIDAFFANRVYCEEVVVANGKPPVQGKDASIEYFFETSRAAKPQAKEDGTVDFFELDLISHCKEGDVLAKLTPEDPGQDGWNIFNKPVMPDKVQKHILKGNKNTVISEDKLTLSAKVSGHVNLNQGEVMVSNVYTVQGVDASTGNINYDGSVVVNGDVESGFSIKATGDIEVKGVVGGAILNAKGNIIVNRGVNGQEKGEITAGGNVVSKFINAASVKAGGSVSTESIMRAKVQAKTEVYVDGKKGFIAGGHVSAKERITAKTLGSEMGANTLIEVGVDPSLKEKVKLMQAQIKDAEKKKEAIAGPLANFTQLIKRGAQLKEDQQKYVQQLLMQNKILDSLIEKNTAAIEDAKVQMKDAKRADVIVMDTAYPGTTIGISDLSKEIKSPVKYSRFYIDEGDIRIGGI